MKNRIILETGDWVYYVISGLHFCDSQDINMITSNKEAAVACAISLCDKLEMPYNLVDEDDECLIGFDGDQWVEVRRIPFNTAI